MYADFDQKEKARTSIPKVANFLQLGLRLILMKYIFDFEWVLD